MTPDSLVPIIIYNLYSLSSCISIKLGLNPSGNPISYLLSDNWSIILFLILSNFRSFFDNSEVSRFELIGLLISFAINEYWAIRLLCALSIIEVKIVSFE